MGGAKIQPATPTRKLVIGLSKQFKKKGCETATSDLKTGHGAVCEQKKRFTGPARWVA